MNYSKYRFNLDMQSYISQIALPVRQHDTGIVLRINLTDGGVPYVIEDGCRAVFCARKADGNPLMSDCVIEKNTTICYELTQQTTACSGVVDCEIRLYGTDGNLITTPRFILVVDSRVVHDDDFPVSDSEQTILDNIILSETARQANEVAREEAEAERESAEAKRAKVFNEAEAEREEAFDEALETAERAQDIADTLTKKLEAGEFLGKSVFIRYSDNADGTGYTEVWNGEFYIGIAVAVTAPTDKSGYNWTRFYGDPVSFNELTDVPYSYLDVDENGYLCLSEDKTIGSPMGFVGQIASNALKGNVSGSAVAMKDVSPLEHELDVKVSIKKLIPYPFAETTKTENGITFTDNGYGTITANGTATAKTTFLVSNGVPIGSGESQVYTWSALTEAGGDTTFYAYCIVNDDYYYDVGEGKSFTCDNATFSAVIVIAEGATVNNVVFKPQLKADADVDVDISSLEVKRYGKNLLLYPYRVITETRNGITIADNGDGARTFDGTATSLVDFHLGFINVRNGVQYTISSNLTGSSPSTYQLWFRSKGGGVGNYYGIEKYGVTFTPTTDDIIEVFLYIYKDATVNNMVFKPQLEVGTTATPYEPYIEPTTYQVEADGTVKGIMSLYPSTTLVTDNRAIIECEYNRDINKAFEELRQIIISLGGNI